MPGLRYRIRTQFSFSKDEWKQLATTIGILSFILSFHSWGTTTFNVTEGLRNLVRSLVLVSITLLVHVSLQKIVALYLGYLAVYKYWLNGLLVGLFFAFFTFGFPPIQFITAALVVIPFFAIGTVDILHQADMRLGKWRYGTNFKDLARVAFAGVLGNIFLVILLQIVYLSSRESTIGQFAMHLITINIILATFAMLPLPSCSGLSIFRNSRVAYVFLLAFTIIFFGLIVWGIAVPGAGVFSLVAAATMASLVAHIYNKTVEPA